ncbi:ornithine carbamoyltransferase [Erwinia sp. E602]|uniref:DUF6950 family protein n=1 Tax=Erwinia sp. E602 TaxID=2675378 RepID=UPI001BA44B67|nr:ornithine carbamoyltransferase [Erwinia sp. E602]QUG75857.1 ornithine carbamoyltransferase [Erwinia sp. E602]
MNNLIMEILFYSMDTPYEFGVNDCNLQAMKITDLFLGTEYSKVQYSTVKEGIEKYQELGFKCPSEIVLKHGVEVSPRQLLDGDIWISDENPLIMAVVASDRILGVDEEHNNFKLERKPEDGKFYRIRKEHG